MRYTLLVLAVALLHLVHDGASAADLKPLVINPGTGLQQQLQAGDRLKVPTATGGFFTTLDPGVQTATRVFSYPIVAADQTLVVLGIAQTFTASQTFPAGTTGAPPINIGQGVAPTSPTNGDVWLTSAGLFARAGGATAGPFAGAGSVPTGTGFVHITTGAQDAAARAVALASADVSGITPSANGGTGVNNTGTLTNATNSTITGGGTLALGGFTLTVPATGTASLGSSATLYTPGTTTWNKPAGCTVVTIWMIGGGGGGGSGRFGSTGTASSGGGGGAPAGWAQAIAFPASMLPSSVTVVCGAKGTGGAAQTVASTNGNPGTVGGNSTFGTTTDAFYVYATGGNFGLGGLTAASNGGATASPSMTLLIPVSYTVGIPGGTGNTSSAIAGAVSCISGGGAGGGGSGCTAANAAATAGGAGGGSGSGLFIFWNASIPAGGTAGNGGTGGNGANGQGVLNAAQICHGQGGGGGGGGLAGGGNGANGANYGAGGGGGGGSQTGNSGKGGDGADGVVLITTY